MKSIFEEAAYREVLERLEKIDERTQREWGKMDAGQMFYHCQFPLSLALGRYHMKKPNPFMRLVMKSFRDSMYNDKLWKPNLPTYKPFKVDRPKSFQNEKNKLIALIHDMYGERDKTIWKPHPAFGNLTPKQWGQMQYKHLDHHLRQFGV
ncbi:MAG: DUF1569 domain-containing protein [Bacteroidota bacterium]